MPAKSRRSFLAGSLAAAVTGSLAHPSILRASVPRFTSNPFVLGVASGYPTASGVVLWTRIVPSPLEPGGGVAPDAVVPVQWEVAADDRMSKVVRRGTEYATAEWAHSVHAEVEGLEPARDYWYRFTVGDARSVVGRTRTAQALGAAASRLRVSVASCQHYEHGYFSAYRHMLADELDLIVHVGDYIYEFSYGDNPVRSHGTPEPYTLEDYRIRYAIYKSDPDLAAAHAAYPWLVTWDDHEVDNDYAGEVSEENDDPEIFLARRAAAYRA
jgi:alkaline phosphatase D